MKTEEQERDGNLYETDWDRSDHGECLPHHIGIDELGNFQCMYCLALLDNPKRKGLIIQCLEDLHGDTWEEEWRRLQLTRKLVKAHTIHRLTEERYAFRNEDGTIKTIRYFYHVQP